MVLFAIAGLGFGLFIVLYFTVTDKEKLLVMQKFRGIAIGIACIVASLFLLFKNC
jgi:hypothetical protein